MSDTSYYFLSSASEASDTEEDKFPKTTEWRETPVLLELDKYDSIRQSNIGNKELIISVCIQHKPETRLRFIISDFTIFVIVYNSESLPVKQIFLADVFDYNKDSYFPTFSIDEMPSFASDRNEIVETYTLRFNGTDRNRKIHRNFFVAEISAKKDDHEVVFTITNTKGDIEIIGDNGGDPESSRLFETNRNKKYEEVSKMMEEAENKLVGWSERLGNVVYTTYNSFLK